MLSYSYPCASLYAQSSSWDQAGIIDWCFTSSFVPTNTDHRRLSSILSLTTNVSPREPEDRTILSACTALRLAGLQLEECEDLAQREDKIAWYEPLERALRDSRMSIRQSWTMWPLDGDNADENWYTAFGMSRDAAIVILEAARRKVGVIDAASSSYTLIFPH